MALISVDLAYPCSIASAQSNDEFGSFDEEFDESRRSPSTAPAASPSPSPAAAQPTARPGDEFGDIEDGVPSTNTAPATAATRTQAEPTAARTPATPQATREQANAARRRQLFLTNSRTGAVGGIHLVDAGSGPSQSFRVGLLTDFFFAGSYLRQGDQNNHIGGALSVSWTPLDFLEIYGSITSYANSNNTESPELFQVLGDSTLGIKGFYRIMPWLTAGGDFSVALLNTVGGIGVVGDGISFGLRGNLSADFRELESNAFPLIARLNLSYYFDNSNALTEPTERARYDRLSNPRPYADETRHLLSRVERFALNINRTDMFTIGLGGEAPIEALPNLIISPLLEWTIGIPVNRNSYSCLYLPGDGVGTVQPVATENDGCLDRQGGSAFPSKLTLGVRVQPMLPGLSLTAAVDIGVLGTSTFVRELAGQAPYNVYLGLAYAYDARTPEPVIQEVERRVEVAAIAPIRGRVVGTVVERGTTTAIANAVVNLVGTDLTALSTNATGNFTSYELAPGEVRLAVTHPEYREGTCQATIAEAGGDVTVQCELEALPRVGLVRGRVISDSGQPVANARLAVTGTATFNLTSDASGSFNREGLAPGVYIARVDADGFLLSQAQFDIRPRETTNADINLIARPARALVQLRNNEIVISRQVNFGTDSAEILADSTALLAEVADTILRHPELTSIEVQGHTDNRGAAAHNLDLSQRRADSVRDWLVRAGVDRSRLQTQGYGDTRPIAPNITARNRGRNRRVQFIVTR